MRSLVIAATAVATMSIASCGDAPPPIVVPVAPMAIASTEAGPPPFVAPPARVRTLAAGDSSTCLVRSGKVWCFGATPEASANRDYDDSMPVPRPIAGIDDAVSVAVSNELVCILRRGGAVSCFGEVDDGTLGDKTHQRWYVPRRIATPEPIAGLVATQIAVGDEFGCAVRAAGDVVCWGLNRDGELGDGSKVGHLTPVPVAGITDAVEVAAGFRSACVRRKSGDVWCWGSPAFSLPPGKADLIAPHAVDAFAGALRISVSRGRTCALRANGDAACAQAPDYLPSQTEMLSAIDLAGGNDMICGLTAKGGVECSGEADYGQLGRAGDRVQNDTAAVADGITDAVEIAAGQSHGCALAKSGELRCWGKNDWGQIGASNSIHVATPTKVDGVTDATRVALSGGNACAVRRGGDVVCWGDGSGTLGDGGTGQDASGLTIDVSPPVSVSDVSDASDIAAGGAHVCVVRRSGKVSCWGDNRWGQIGNPNATGDPRSAPTDVPGVGDAIDIDANGIATCVARKSGKVTCWGTPPDAHAPPLAQVWTGPGQGTFFGLRDVARVGASDDRGCAVRRDGTAVCWGFEVDTVRDSKEPKRAFVELRGARDVAQIAVGDDGLVLFRSGELRELDFHSTFHAPQDGQKTTASLPLGAKIADDARLIARCVTGDCFVRKSGEVACVADGKVKTFGITDAVDVAAESGTRCVVRKNGEVDCWGDNDGGQCGVDPHVYSLLPVAVAGLPAP